MCNWSKNTLVFLIGVQSRSTPTYNLKEMAMSSYKSEIKFGLLSLCSPISNISLLGGKS